MKPTDFSKYLTGFFTKYLPHEMGLSSNTVVSYRDTFVLMITFMEQEKSIKPEKLELISITKKLIVEFLDWLEWERKSAQQQEIKDLLQYTLSLDMCNTSGRITYMNINRSCPYGSKRQLSP